MDLAMDLIRAIRNLRSEIGLTTGRKTPVILRVPHELRALLQEEQVFLEKLAWVEQVTFLKDSEGKPSQALTALVDEIEIYLPLEGVIDLPQEIARLEKDLLGVEKDLAKAAAKLDNENFMHKAPADIVAKEKNKKEELRGRREKLAARIAELRKLGGA